MGEFTGPPLIQYKPARGEGEWDALVNDNFEKANTWAAGVEGGGSGSGLPWINVQTSPYDCDPTGTLNCNAGLQAAMTALIALGRGTLYLPAGVYKWNRQIGHLDDGAFTIRGDGPGATVLLVDDDTSNDSLFSVAGRHGYPESPRYGPFIFRDFSVINPDGYNSNAFGDQWQIGESLFTNLYLENIGGGFGFTAPRRTTIRDVTLVDCGDITSGTPAVSLTYSDEGGTVSAHGVPEYCTLDNVKVYNPKDFGFYLGMGRGCQVVNCYGDGSGDGRSVFYGIDLDGSTIIGNQFLNGHDDCLHLASKGLSQNNLVMGNTCLGALGGTPGTGYGINEFSANDEQTHTDNVIEHNIGTVHRA